MKQVLTVAGSDSGAGAGIQADLKAIHANGCYALTAITAVTAQNTVAVRDSFDLPLDIVRSQLAALFEDFDIAAAKTGMLSSPALVETVATALREHEVPKLVVDPVMISKSGYSLLREEAVDAVRELLLPLAAVVTPNLPETEVLSGLPTADEEQRVTAARRILALGPAAVLVKGGHGEGTTVTDLLVTETATHRFEHPRLVTRTTHGTGCTLSAALAARLALGEPLAEAVAAATDYVFGAVGAGLELGHGHGPTNHFFRQREGRR